MKDRVIKVEGLGKEYRIGARAPYGTLRESLVRGLKMPFKKASRLLRGQVYGATGMEETIWALKDVSFDIGRGEVAGIIGRNGAGKTTLLKILSRITDPSEGRVEISGRVGSLLEVGTGFHGELTGRENVFLNGAILGMKRREISAKFDEIVAFAEVERFIDTPLKFYSSGMYVRLAFAIAAHLEPEILLVDEVLAVGDVIFQKKCLGKMKNAAGQGRTVLFVSHNMSSVMNLCGRAILLSAGRVKAAGKTDEVVRRYLTTDTASKGEIIWSGLDNAPGNDIVRLRAVRILQDGIDGPAADVDISKDVIIEITYSSLRDDAVLYPAIRLTDRMGTVIMASSNGPSMTSTRDEWYGRPYPRGLFRSVCRIPANFLNEGHYGISAILGRVPGATQVAKDGLLSFYVHDTGGMRKEFTGGWEGMVRPRLAWHTERVRSEAEMNERVSMRLF